MEGFNKELCEERHHRTNEALERHEVKIENLENTSLYTTAAVVAKGMLLSARGNSGVILSKFFEGIAKGLEKEHATNSEGFAKALGKRYDEISREAEN